MRDTDYVVYYFSSASDFRIRNPPQIPLKNGISVDDLYVHSSGRFRRAWSCVAIQPAIQWEALPELQRRTFAGVEKVFVITNLGFPGWVAQHTITRRYKKATPISIATGDDIQGNKAEAKDKGKGKAKDRGKDGREAMDIGKDKGKDRAEAKDMGKEKEKEEKEKEKEKEAA